MFMIHKEIIYLYIFIACCDCPLTPVILFSVSFSEILFIQKSNLSDCFDIHTHAEAHTSRHNRILWTDHTEFIIDLPQRHFLEQLIISAKIRKAADRSTGSKRCGSSNIVSGKNRKHQTFQPFFRNFHICIHKRNMIFCHLKRTVHRW